MWRLPPMLQACSARRRQTIWRCGSVVQCWPGCRGAFQDNDWRTCSATPDASCSLPLTQHQEHLCGSMQWLQMLLWPRMVQMPDSGACRRMRQPAAAAGTGAPHTSSAVAQHPCAPWPRPQRCAQLLTATGWPSATLEPACIAQSAVCAVSCVCSAFHRSQRRRSMQSCHCCPAELWIRPGYPCL